MAIGVGEAILASTGANILAGAFGGNSNPQGINYNMNRELSQRSRFDQQRFDQSQKWLTQQGRYDRYQNIWKRNLDLQTDVEMRRRDRENKKWDLNQIYGRQVQTKVNDAKAAGLHPLFAMGSQGYAPPPQQAFSGGGMPGGRTPSAPSGIAGQSSRGNFATEALASIAAGFTQFANVQAQKDLVEAQKEASQLRVAGQPGNGNDAAEGLAIVSKVQPKEIAPSIAIGRDKSEQQSRDYITPDGKAKVGVVPKGTPFEMLEKEFGEWANLHPDTLKRFFGFLQNTDYIPSGADLKAWFNDWTKTNSIKAPRIKK